VPVLGDGEQIRCFTIFDVAEPIARFSLRPEIENQVVNIGNPEPLTVKELAAKIVELGKELGCSTRILDSASSTTVYADDVKKRIPT